MSFTQQLKQLQDVFSRSAFIIPDYQRGYAWTAQHRGDLLDDLTDLEALSPEKVHYTGTLVLHRGRHAPRQILGKAFDLLDVVDGQQRLTSLAILLSTFAREFAHLGTADGTERARNLRETFVAYRDLMKLVPNGGAAPFFRDHVVGDVPNPSPASSPERALLEARTQFEKFIAERTSGLSQDGKVAWLEEWSLLVTTRLGFVVFEVEEEADVGTMFEAMNARGKPLTQFELVKNYLLFAVAKIASGTDLKALTDDVNHTWSHIVRSLDGADLSDSDDTLLRYHWYIWPFAQGLFGDPVYKTYNLHRAIKESIRPSEGKDIAALLIQRYLADLRLATNAYADVVAPGHAKAFTFAGPQAAALSDEAASLARIDRSAVVLPALMAATMQFGTDHGALKEFIRLARSLVFRLSVIGSRANKGEPKLMKLALDIRKKKLSAASAQQRLRDVILDAAPDDLVKRWLLESDSRTDDGDFYTWPQLPYLLFEYERSLVLAAKQKFAYDWAAFYAKRRESIEHILPQGENTLAEPYWAARFDEQQWRRNRHRLGNLTLTEWNSSYGNRGFDEKAGAPDATHDAKVYRNSRFHCERELAAESEWNEAAIDRRQARIADFAVKHWST